MPACDRDNDRTTNTKKQKEMKDMNPRYKIRFVQQFGKLKQSNGEWYFVANPLVDCPVKEMINRSKWSIVDTVYDAIVSYR